MRLDKLTIKAQEALQAAQGVADDASSQVMEPEHLLKVLLDAAEGVARPIVQKLGADPDALEAGAA
ncbi:MAG: Clp protease N-terminal domain-containing protein, partial [Coriobacteriia bacterium]|nr:Clp protease N-terminal domain-containing protein [Coriobacteriia bacterium]